MHASAEHACWCFWKPAMMTALTVRHGRHMLLSMQKNCPEAAVTGHCHVSHITLVLCTMQGMGTHNKDPQANSKEACRARV